MLHLGDDVEGPSCILASTRHNGRHIDYALHSFNVFPHGRSQCPGVADHDLVTYIFKVANLEPTSRVAPARRLKATEPVSEAGWKELFPDHEFCDLIFQGKIQEAWDLISDTAETCLQPSAGRKRSLVPEPTQVAVKVEAFQSMRKHKLRRLHRRLMELRKLFAPWSLVRKVRQDIARFCPSFPEIGEIDIFSSEILQVVEDCILKENTASQEERLNKRRVRMSNDEAALIHWVKATCRRFGSHHKGGRKTVG